LLLIKLNLSLPTKFQIQAKTRAEDIAKRLGARRTSAAKKGKQEQDPLSESEEAEEGDEGISEILSNDEMPSNVDEMEVDEADQDEVEGEISEAIARVKAKPPPKTSAKAAPKPPLKIITPTVKTAIPRQQLGSHALTAPTAASTARRSSKSKATGEISKPYILRADSKNVVIYPTRLEVNSSTTGARQTLSLETSAPSVEEIEEILQLAGIRVDEDNDALNDAIKNLSRQSRRTTVPVEVELLPSEVSNFSKARAIETAFAHAYVVPTMQKERHL
jgi:hypothetical protein